MLLVPEKRENWTGRMYLEKVKMRTRERRKGRQEEKQEEGWGRK